MRNAVWLSTMLMILLVACRASVGSEAEPDGGVAEAPRTTIHESLANAEWLDLTHAFDEQTIYWPTETGFELLHGPAGLTEGGFYYAANRFAAAEHGGTHIDSPVHFYESGDTVDEIPLRRLIGEGIVVDVSEKCAAEPDYQIGVADLRSWEEVHGRKITDTLVLLRTGWGSFWPDRERYLGTAELGADAVAELRFPGLHPEAAQWLVEQRSVRAVGIDTASIDFGQSQLFQSHVALFEHDVPVFENVASLDALPDQGFTVIALPMKIADGTGGPLRIVALLAAETRSP